MEKMRGNAFCFGDNIDTDQILPGYAMSSPEDQLGTFALKGSAIPNFPEVVKKGDVILAGDNFGCGSSREQAPVAIKQSGISVIIAKSYARIFRRNSINIGLPVLISAEVDQMISDISQQDILEVDVDNLTVKNTSKNKEYKINPINEVTLETLKAGGLINKVIMKLEEKRCQNG